MLLLSAFAALALFLATVGVYGVVSQVVSQGTREIGVRMALGAGRRDVLLLVIAQGMKLVTPGVALGMLAALGLKRWMDALLYDARGADPATFVSIAALLIVVALLACYIPARRATNVDPMIALRHE
jgi:ABC-type antimicrobial peptide transport system permease subunit